jgi:hypothetical protein
MVFSPILELGKRHAVPTPQPPVVVGSPRYYQLTGQKPPKMSNETAGTTVCLDKDDTMSINSLEKPSYDPKPSKSRRLAEAFGLKSK